MKIRLYMPRSFRETFWRFTSDTKYDNKIQKIYAYLYEYIHWTKGLEEGCVTVAIPKHLAVATPWGPTTTATLNVQHSSWVDLDSIEAESGTRVGGRR